MKNKREFQTDSEEKFAALLDSRGITYIANHKIKFKRRYGRRRCAVVDFWIPRANAIVEIDGSVHRRQFAKCDDSFRTWAIRKSSDVRDVYRLWNGEVSQGLDNPFVRNVLNKLAGYDIVKFYFTEPLD